MRGKDCARRCETAWFFTALTAQDGMVPDVNIVDLIREGAITLDDLAEFSEELQEQVRFLVER